MPDTFDVFIDSSGFLLIAQESTEFVEGIVEAQGTRSLCLPRKTVSGPCRMSSQLDQMRLLAQGCRLTRFAVLRVHSTSWAAVLERSSELRGVTVKGD